MISLYYLFLPGEILSHCAEVAELADALASGASGRKPIGVQIPASAPPFNSISQRNSEQRVTISPPAQAIDSRNCPARIRKARPSKKRERTWKKPSHWSLKRTERSPGKTLPASRSSENP